MAVEATGYYVIVLPDVVEEKSQGGIILAKETLDSNKYATIHGTIVDIGPIAWHGFGDGRPWASIGDRVIYARYAGKRLEDPDNPELEYVLMCDNDILAITKRKDSE